MERYKEYKSTSIQWLKDIPSHWEEKRAKYLFNKENRLPEESDEVITCFRDGTVTLRKNRRTSGFTESLKEIGYQGIKKGDLVIHQMDAFAGSTGVSDSDGKGTPVYSVCTPKENTILTQYFAKVIRHMGLNGFIQSLYRGIRERSSDFRFETFARQILPVPPASEQEKIVSYLDTKTSKIDAYVAERERELQLLSELKESEIANVVTRGLNPDVKMKDSGIHWIGMIPEHWEVDPFGRHFTYSKGLPITKADLLPEGIAVISYGQIHAKTNTGVTMAQHLIRYVSNSYLGTHPQCLLQQNDFVFADTSEDIEGSGNFAFNDYPDKIFAGYHTLVARPKDLLFPKYYAYLFKSSKLKSQVRSLVNGVKVYTINKRILKNAYILIPSLKEQQDIVAFADSKCAKINSLISELEAEIEYLKEYKQRLIADCVTGQIKVL